MNRKIKLIWDFRGLDALKTAEHQAIHLKEFVLKEKLPFYECNFTQISEKHTIAFIIIDEANMKIYRDALLPHRGEIAK